MRVFLVRARTSDCTSYRWAPRTPHPRRDLRGHRTPLPLPNSGRDLGPTFGSRDRSTRSGRSRDRTLPRGDRGSSGNLLLPPGDPWSDGERGEDGGGGRVDLVPHPLCEHQEPMRLAPLLGPGGVRRVPSAGRGPHVPPPGGGRSLGVSVRLRDVVSVYAGCHGRGPRDPPSHVDPRHPPLLRCPASQRESGAQPRVTAFRRRCVPRRIVFPFPCTRGGGSLTRSRNHRCGVHDREFRG